MFRRINFRRYETAIRFLAKRGIQVSSALVESCNDSEILSWFENDIVLRWNKITDSACILYRGKALPYLS